MKHKKTAPLAFLNIHTKRDHDEIIYLLLSEMENHSPETKYCRLLYVSNSLHLSRYLKGLLERGLITEQRQRRGRFIKMTETGILLLKKLQELDSLVPFESLRAIKK